MSRRRNPGLVESLVDTLIKLPPWVSVALGVVSYVALESYQRTAIAPKAPVLLSVSTSLYPPIALSFFVAMAVISAFHRFRRGRLVDEQTGLETLKTTPWKHFEYLVAEAFRRQGYAVDYSMDSGPDGGVDVVLQKGGRKTLVQCKRRNQYSVGVSVVREMFGILHDQKADEVMVVTTGEFTADASAFAKGKPIRLINGPELWQMVREVQSGAKEQDLTNAISPPEVRHAVAMTTSSPACPLCATPMVRRTAKRGANAGNQFWGCETYPSCKGVRN